MKKILLNLLIIMLSLFCIIACGKIKKDPEVIKYIIDKVNNDINNIKNTPAKERGLDVTSLRIREVELSKNIKLEVTDVISSKEFIEIYLKNLEERNKKAKEGGMFSKISIINPPSLEQIEEFKKNKDVVYYKYTISADIVNLKDILKKFHPEMENFMELGRIHSNILNFLNEENKGKLEYESVEGYGYFYYNTKTGECSYASDLKGLSGEIDILGFLSARGYDKYNIWTAQKLK